MNWASRSSETRKPKARMPPRAIREDHDPLQWMAGIGPGTLLAFVRWSYFRCPHCRQVLRRTYLPNEVVLGNGEGTCPKCQGVFDSGFREWPELSVGEKMRYILPTPLMGLIGAFLVCAFVAVYAVVRRPGAVSWTFLGYAAVVFTVFLTMWSLLRLSGILRSVSRHSARRRVA
jgi:hypothetical protein